MHRFRLVHAVALAGAVLVSCEKSPFEPRGEGERVPIGVAIEGQVRTDSVRWYSFAGRPNQPVVIFLEALHGDISLIVFDSTHGFTTANNSAFAGGPALEENPSNTFELTADAVYRISVRAISSGTARFRFKVYAINTSAERVPDVFSFGDTVNGETIDPMIDLDLFHAYGVAGQEIVAVVEAQGPAGSGAVFLHVLSESGNNVIGTAFAIADTANRTTGRIRLTGTRDYPFVFGSITSNQYPRYRGPYRFSTYVIDRAPEHRAAAIAFNTEIGNERIDRAGDVDEFTFVGTAGTEFNAFVQGRGRTFQLEVARQGGESFALATSQASDTGLFERATNRFRVTQAGTHVVRLTGTNPTEVADTGAYRIYLYRIDPRPERVPSTIASGDTVAGEDIGLPGDVDEFTFSGVAGAEYNVFVQAQSGSSDSRLQVEVVDAAGTTLRRVESYGNDTSLLQRVTGRFALPSTGVYRTRVSGVDGFGMPYYRGAYRVSLYQVDRRPESQPVALALGDSLSGEAIDMPGDVDEFTVTISDSSGAHLAVAIESTTVAGGMIAQFVNATTGQVIATAGAPQLPLRGSAGALRVGPGNYLVRVWTSTYEYDQSTFRGGYRIWLYRFAFGPEVAADTFAIGDTVSGESIEPWGDSDQFHFYGLRGQHVNIMVQGLSPPASNGWYEFSVWPPPGAPGYGLFINTETSAGALEDHQTTRLDLPASGWYTVQVHGGSAGFAGFGPYRFVVQLLDPGPEHVGDTLAAGDSVVSEPIDAPGDWDEFTVLGSPGRTMSLLFDSDVFTGLYLQVFDPVTHDTLAWQPNQFRRIVGPFLMPASGQVRVAVSQPAGFFRLCYDSTCGGVFSAAGPYAFHVIAVNRAPENVPTAIAVGDTIRGETISPVGDIDEFTSTATPGEQLRLLARLPTGASSGDSAIVVEAIDPATGTSLAGSNAATWGDTFWEVGTFTAPASGTFLVRTRVYGEWGYGVGVTTYEFLVKRGP